MQDKVRNGVAEDRVTGAIEAQTSKIPSSGYLAAAFGAIAASLENRGQRWASGLRHSC
jgi:hypothetical protein